MSTPNDGGPAFPVVRMPLDPDTILNRQGMSLRDWYIGQALVGLCANPELSGMNAHETAKAAVQHADEVMEARAK